MHIYMHFIMCLNTNTYNTCDFSELNYHDRNGSNLQWTKFFSDLNIILFYDIHCNNVFEI